MRTTTVILWLIIILNCWLLYRAIDNQSNVYKQGFEAGRKEGFEAGKNFVPASMQRADSLSVVYYGNKPMVSDHIKMPRDSVQLVIDSFMGKPKQYLLMTLKLVTKERE